MKILHVLHHSFPYLDGYAVRSNYIVQSQRSAGLDPIVVTSMQHEVETGRGDAGRDVPCEEIGGTVHHRTTTGRFVGPMLKIPALREAAMMVSLGRRIRALVKQFDIDLVHAHSPLLCGLPALMAGRSCRVPVVYEVRSFWEDGFPGGPASLKYRLCRSLETAIFRRVDGVVSISALMLEDIAARGVRREKLLRVPNGVDASRFMPSPRDPELVARFDLQNKPVAGFIGSLAAYEGLDVLVTSMLRLRQALPNARLLIVGGGEEEARVRAQVQALDLQQAVTVVGRVPHQDVARYYSLMDVVVYPRRSDRTTEVTTPLKPLEAMAAKCCVIGSDVGGIRELFDGGEIGALFPPGDAGALADMLSTLLTDVDTRTRQAEAGYQFALRQHDWNRVVLGYVDLYRALLSPAGSPRVGQPKEAVVGQKRV